jgi:hypothetical protein
MATTKKPVVDEKRRMQEALDEHEEMLKIYGGGLRCSGCKKRVGSDWEACPNCGNTKADVDDAKE